MSNVHLQRVIRGVTVVRNHVGAESQRIAEELDAPVPLIDLVLRGKLAHLALLDQRLIGGISKRSSAQ